MTASEEALTFEIVLISDTSKEFKFSQKLLGLDFTPIALPAMEEEPAAEEEVEEEQVEEEVQEEAEEVLEAVTEEAEEEAAEEESPTEPAEEPKKEIKGAAEKKDALVSLGLPADVVIPPVTEAQEELINTPAD